MPIHDWKKADSGLFHHFHQRWISAITDRLNGGGLPAGFYAFAALYAQEPYAEVLALERGPEWTNPKNGGIALIDTPPRTRFHSRAVTEGYANKANRIAVHHPLGDVVAIIEIVSPGNKASKAKLNQFVEKTVQLLRNGVHVLLIDLFPPTRRDPQGIHKLVWDEFVEEPFELPSDKQLTLASYSASTAIGTFVEPVAIGDSLTEMPLFLEPKRHVPIPLESTYIETWDKIPEPYQRMPSMLDGK